MPASRLFVCGFQRSLDFAERCVQIIADERQSADDRDSDKRGDKTKLNGRCAGLVLDKPIDDCVHACLQLLKQRS